MERSDGRHFGILPSVVTALWKHMDSGHN